MPVVVHAGSVGVAPPGAPKVVRVVAGGGLLELDLGSRIMAWPAHADRRDVLDLCLRPRGRDSGGWRRSPSSWPLDRSYRGPRRTSARSRPRPTRTPATGRPASSSCAAVGTGRGGRRRIVLQADGDRAQRPGRRRRRCRTRGDLRRMGVAAAGPKGVAGDGYAAQGNILVSAETVDAIVDAFAAAADLPLAERLIRLPCRRAGCQQRPWPAVGGIARRRAGRWLHQGLSDTLVDLRADDHERPVRKLAGSIGSITRCSEDAARRLAAGRRRASRRDRGAAARGRV